MAFDMDDDEDLRRRYPGPPSREYFAIFSGNLEPGGDVEKLKAGECHVEEMIESLHADVAGAFDALTNLIEDKPDVNYVLLKLCSCCGRLASPTYYIYSFTSRTITRGQAPTGGNDDGPDR